MSAQMRMPPEPNVGIDAVGKASPAKALRAVRRRVVGMKPPERPCIG